MKSFIVHLAVALGLSGISSTVIADTTTITAGLNAPTIGASGGSQVFWGPVVAQTSLEFSGVNNTFYPRKYAGTTISGSGGAAGGRKYCFNPGDPTSGPGTIVPPSSDPVYEWFCNVNPPPPAPQVDFEFYKYLAQMQGNACGGRPCYQSGANVSFSSTYDPVCTANGHPKVWFFEGDVSFSGGTYFCGVLLSRGAVTFTGGGAGNVSATPPANAWEQYEVATPNGVLGSGDTAAADEYPGDNGSHAVKSYTFVNGGGGYNGDPVSFQGYIYATTGYTAGGHTLIVGAVQFGQGAASTAGGGTIFYVPQMIYTVPPGGQVAAPIITPPGGSFTGNVSVTMATLTAGATIHYTLDSSVPTLASPVYTGALNLTADTTVKAYAVRSGLVDSSVTTAVFTVASGPANTRPVVNAGLDQSITLPAAASLSGSATDDGIPDPPGSLIYGWNQISGPGLVTFANPGGAVTTASFSQAGTYVLRLTASDGQLADDDDVQIVVAATPPPNVRFDAGTYTATEGAGYKRITVLRSGSDLSGATTVRYTTSDGASTLAGRDYLAVSGTLSYAASETSKTFDVPILNNGLANGNKTVLLKLSVPTGATLGTPNQATLTITDDGAAAPPPAPFISYVSPFAVHVNYASAFDMRIVGTGFDTTSALVIWNGGTPMTVLSRSATEIRVRVSPSIWNHTAGIYPILVRNPGNVDSNEFPFEVVPVVSMIPPPFVIQGPQANPNPTYTTTTQLMVRANTFSLGGEGNLRYHWEAVGPQPAGYSFAANGSNAAKDNTVTFRGAGAFRFRVLVRDVLTNQEIASPSVDVSVVQRAASLALSPKTQTITPDQTVTLTATVRDQFGATLSPALNWTTSGGTLAPHQTSAVLSASGGAQAIRIRAALVDNSLSDYADVAVLYGVGGVANLDQAVLGPVPYKSTSGLPGITFRQLNPGTTIRIFTADGQLVRTLSSPDGSNVLFDIRNSSGKRVASGVYIYVMEYAGHVRKGKLVLIL